MEKKRAPLSKRKVKENNADDRQMLIEKIKKLQQIANYADILTTHNHQYQKILSIYEAQIDSLKAQFEVRKNQNANLPQNNHFFMGENRVQHKQEINILLEKIKQLESRLQQNLITYKNKQTQYQKDIENLQKQISEKNRQISIILLQNSQLKARMQENFRIAEQKVDLQQMNIIKRQLQQVYQENIQLKKKISKDQHQKQQQKTYLASNLEINNQVLKQKLVNNQRRMLAYEEQIAMLSSTIKKYQTDQTEIYSKYEEQLKKKDKLLIDREKQLQEICKNLAFLDQSKNFRNFNTDKKLENYQQESSLKKIIDELTLKNQILQKKMLRLEKQSLGSAQIQLQKQLTQRKNQSQLQRIIINLQAIVKQDQQQMKQLLIDFSNQKVNLMVSSQQESLKMKDYYEEKLGDIQEIAQRKIRILQKQLAFLRQR